MYLLQGYHSVLYAWEIRGVFTNSESLVHKIIILTELTSVYFIKLASAVTKLASLLLSEPDKVEINMLLL